MRTTVTIADDRRGMMRSSASPVTLPAPVAMGARFDLTNIGEVLEILDSQEPGS